MLRKQLESLLSHLEQIGFEAWELVFEPPAQASELRAIESRLGYRLPPKFAGVLQSVSRKVSFSWYSPDGLKFPTPFNSNFSGNIEWALENLPGCQENVRDWAKGVFPNRSDPDHAHWYDKLAFHHVGNGDWLTVDLAPERYEQIVYLDHEGGEENGYVMADDLGDLLRRWAPLAFAGAESWQWVHFTNDHTTAIDPTCLNAHTWRALLRLE